MSPRPPHRGHYLSSSPLLDSETICSPVPLSEPWAAGWVPRGTRSSDRKPSPQPAAPSGGVSGWPQPPGVGGTARVAFVCRSQGWSVGGGCGGSGDGQPAGRGETPRIGSVPAKAAAAAAASAAQPGVSVPRGLQFMARAAEGRGGERKRRRRTAAANLPRSLAWRAGVEPPARRAARRK